MGLPFGYDVVVGKHAPLVVVSDKRNVIPFIILADSHLGAKTFREDIFRRVLEFAKREQAVIVGLGDWIENSNKRSVGKGVFEQVLTPREQEVTMVNLLKPVKDQIVRAVRGNHEERTEKDNGISPFEHICDMLDVGYDEYVVRILFRSEGRGNKTAYTFFGTHSKSASKTTGLDQNTVERDWEKWVNYDIIAKGHGHDMYLSSPRVFEKIDKYNKAVVKKERYFMAGGHYLDYPGSYTEKAVLRPKPLGSLCFYLNMDKANREITSKRIK